MNRKSIHGGIQKKLYKTGNGKPNVFRFSLESGRDGLITFLCPALDYQEIDDNYQSINFFIHDVHNSIKGMYEYIVAPLLKIWYIVKRKNRQRQ
jgi:hypothetical protein